MHAILLFTTKLEEENKEMKRLIQELAVPSYGVIDISPNPTSIGVADIKDLQKKVSFASYDKTERLVVFHEFSKATPEAQNALLKLLEEPPPQTSFLLISKESETILPTILSRVAVKTVKSASEDTTKQEEMVALLKECIEASPGKRLLLIENFTKTREDALRFTDDLLNACTALLDNSPSILSILSLARYIPKIEQAKNALSHNVNVKGTLSVLILSLPGK